MTTFDDAKSLIDKDAMVKLSTVGDLLSSDSGHVYPLRCAPLNVILGSGVQSSKLYEIYGWESCLVSDTLVLTVSGHKKIVDINVGDYVYSANLKDGKREIKKVTYKGERKTDFNLVQLEMVNGEKIRVTTDHEVYTTNGWVQVGDLDSEKAIHTIESFKSSTGLIAVKSITPIDKQPVFDITVEDNHNFFCTKSDLLFHNSGKSTMALEFCYAFSDYWTKLNAKHAVLWIETEYALDKARVEMMFPGKSQKFLVAECETIEEAEDAVIRVLTMAINKNTKLFIVWDTIAAAPTKKEKLGEASMGPAYKAFVVRSMFRKINPLIAKCGATMIFVNQMSKSITPGMQDSTSGGGGLKFHCSVRARLKVVNQLKEFMPNGEEVTKGIITEMFTQKNKLTHAKQSVSITLYGEKGIGVLDTNLRFLKLKNLIDAKGSWATINFPKVLWNKAVKIDPDDEEKGGDAWTTLKFQNIKPLKNAMSVESPHLKEWMDYIIYRYYCTISPLSKVRMIEKMWEYETMFFGERLTTLHGSEISAAKLLYAELQDLPVKKKIDTSPIEVKTDLTKPDAPKEDREPETNTSSKLEEAVKRKRGKKKSAK